MKELSVARKLFYFFPVLYCFCLPFGSLLLSWIVVFWCITSFFNIEKNQLAKGLKHPGLVLFWLFFFLTVLSALFSINKTEAAFSVEVKMAMLVFPYLFFCFTWPVAILKRCVISFVSGCFFASVYLLVRAFLFYLDGQPEYFFYTLFSDLLHASYFSMYLILALVFVFTLYPNWFRLQKSIIYSSYFFVVVFVATIFLCASKMGIITLCLCLPILLVSRWLGKFSMSKMLFFASAVFVLLLSALYFIPDSSERLTRLINFDSAHIDKTSSESTAVRFLIWQQCIDIIQANFVFGTSVGDANDALYAVYETQGLTGALSHKLNAHNQFFQTFIGLGVFGFIVLMVLTLGQLLKALLRRKLLLAFFSFIVCMNFLVESMLQTSAGVIFFSFFSCFFLLVDYNELADGSKLGEELK